MTSAMKFRSSNLQYLHRSNFQLQEDTVVNVPPRLSDNSNAVYFYKEVINAFHSIHGTLNKCKKNPTSARLFQIAFFDNCFIVPISMRLI